MRLYFFATVTSYSFQHILNQVCLNSGPTALNLYTDKLESQNAILSQKQKKTVPINLTKLITFMNNTPGAKIRYLVLDALENI